MCNREKWHHQVEGTHGYQWIFVLQTSGTVSELPIWHNYIERSLDSSGWWIGKLQRSGFAYNIRKCRTYRRQCRLDFIITWENVSLSSCVLKGISIVPEKYRHETMKCTRSFNNEIPSQGWFNIFFVTVKFLSNSSPNAFYNLYDRSSTDYIQFVTTLLKRFRIMYLEMKTETHCWYSGAC